MKIKGPSFQKAFQERVAWMSETMVILEQRSLRGSMFIINCTGRSVMWKRGNSFYASEDKTRPRATLHTTHLTWNYLKCSFVYLPSLHQEGKFHVSLTHHCILSQIHRTHSRSSKWACLCS